MEHATKGNSELAISRHFQEKTKDSFLPVTFLLILCTISFTFLNHIFHNPSQIDLGPEILCYHTGFSSKMKQN